MQTDSPAILDWSHLERVTFGDSALVAELLGLFLAQSGGLVRTISSGQAGADAATHKLKGSARAIGAFALESATVTCEGAIATSVQGIAAIASLNLRWAELKLAIETHLAKASQSSAEQSPSASAGRIEPL